MPVTIDDITPDFLAFWDRAEGRPVAEQRRLWREAYEEPHRTLFEAYYRRQARPDDLEAALARFAETAPRLRAGVPALRRDIERIIPAVGRLFAAPDVDRRWVLMVGLFSADGWVDVMDGEPVCFCAVESVEDLDRAEVLLAHEAAHVDHERCQPDGWRGMDTVGHALFLEGLAVLASVRVNSGTDEAGHLWPGRRRTPGGQAVGDWLAECEAAWADTRAALLGDLHREDAETFAAYFLGRRAHENVPIRVGYFVGYRLLAALAGDRPVADMARWSAERVFAEIARALAQADRCPPSPRP